ncbi:MAG: hypothetical protein L3J14_06370 [Flavobacteriaceae bacterium]|nr:hypothetical protein [Flavobacteriaceae bacterium]
MKNSKHPINHKINEIIKNEKGTLIFILTILIIFLVLAFFKNKKDENLFLIGHYTYGKVTDIKAMKGGLRYYYEFKISGVSVKGKMRSGRFKNVNDRCFVIFDPNDYNNNKMLLQLHTVPDSITETPRSGWKDLPININKSKIRKVLQ